MEIYKKEFKDIWLKAAVLGSLWGSIEIIIGSFFHNIRFPMAGTILAVLGIAMITAFGQIWKDKGLFWRAGLISALMKSVSPSAILIGPMTGIFMEALLFELVLILFGRNYAGYILGGIIAVYSVILHKVFSLLIIYGFDLVRITENLYFFIAKQLQIENLSFLNAFLIFSSIYVILGMIASLFGIVIGKKVKKSQPRKKTIKLDTQMDVIQADGNFGAVYMILFHISIIIGILALSNMVSFEIGVGLTVIYSLYAIIKYKRPLRYLKKPGFWIQIILFALVSALFYDGFNKGSFFSEEGIFAGLQMATRAILIVIGFSAISSELRNPFIKIMLYRRGFKQLYTALGLAFSVLPYLIKRSAASGKILKNPIKSLTDHLNDAHGILHEFEKKLSNKEAIIITGKKQEGKTTFIIELIAYLKSFNLNVSGFIALGKFDKGQRSEFSIQNIQTEETKLLCDRKGAPDRKRIGRFYFYENGLNFGKTILMPENLNKEDYIVVDEVGPFELKGKGWSRSVDHLLNSEYKKLILIVRENLVYDILRRFGITNALIFNINKNNPKELALKLSKKLSKKVTDLNASS